MILDPGTFKVSNYRKAIPDWVKVVAALHAVDPSMLEIFCYPDQIVSWVRSLRYDHRPPLSDRRYDTDVGDFIPPQNDPNYIEAIEDKVHDERTFGRKADAEKTVTTAGSDAHNRKRVRNLSRQTAEHDLKMAAKAGDTEAMKQVVANLEKDRRRPKIKSRGFPKKQRPMRRAS